MTESLSHDAVIGITETDYKFLSQVKEVVDQAIEQKNPSIAFNFALTIRRAAQVQGWGLAMLLYEMKQEWNGDGAFQSDDKFERIAAERLGYSPSTIERHITTWERVLAKPKMLTDDGSVKNFRHKKEQRKRILGHALNTAYRMAAASAEGEMTEDDWERFYTAPNKQAVMELRSEIRGEKTSSVTSLKIMIEDDGGIVARRDGPYEPTGLLYLNRRGESEVIDAAIERIIRGSGIFKRG